MPRDYGALPTGLEGLLPAQYCWSRPELLEQGIKRLWSQLFQAKNLFFWAQSGIPMGQLHLAVLIQPLPPVTASGFLQVTATHGVIQSLYGLSLSLLRGEALPDVYRVERHTGAIERHLGPKAYSHQLMSEPPDHPAIDSSCVVGQAVEPDQQQQFVLADSAIDALVALGERLADAGNEALTWEWIWFESSTQMNLEAPEIQILGCYDAPVWPTDYVIPISADGVPLTCPVKPTPVSSLPTPAPSRLARGVAAAAGRAIAPAFVTQTLRDHALETTQNQILVVPSFQPEDLPWLERAAGVICETGGLTSHGAIVARELGVPAVVGVAEATTAIQTGQVLLVDGTQGDIFQLDVQALTSSLQKPPFSEPATGPDLPSVPWPLATQIMVNLSQTSSLERARSLTVDGVGLLRSEWMILNALERQHPQLWIQQGRQTDFVARMAEQISQFARTFAPRPITYRSLDLRSHDLAALEGGAQFEPPEINPMLGLRGASRVVRDPQLFDLELMALAQLYDQGLTNIRLLLPFVRSVEEFQFCRDRITAAGLFRAPQFQVWVMAEVPSILFLLPQYVQAGVQGVAIGTNDLTQLLLGVDREHSTLTDTFTETHPAMMAAMAQLIQTARELNIPCSICGQAPARHPELIDALVQWGITAISVDLDAVTVTRGAIARAEQRLLFEAVRAVEGGDRA